MAKRPRYTIADFNRDFPDDDACLEAIFEMVYPNGVMCRKCQELRPHHRLRNRKAYSCDYCGTHVYPLAGTVFEKSTTSLKSWFYAMYLMSSTRCGISAKQLERELGVTYKTAWRMFDQIRKLMAEDNGPLSGEVEVDETWVGGKLSNKAHHKHATDQFANKTAVIGAVQRGGKATAKVIPNVRKSQLLPLVIEHVMPDATVFTDEAKSYSTLEKRGYTHRRVNHKAKVYVAGDAHTNTLEGFWSLMKNGIRGVNHAVGAHKLQGYVDTYTFRYNHRDDPEPMFALLSAQMRKVRHGRYGEYAPVGE